MILPLILVANFLIAFSSTEKSDSDLLADCLKMDSEVLSEHLSSSAAYLADSYSSSGLRLDGPMVKRQETRDSLELLVGRGLAAVPFLLSVLDSQKPSKLSLGSDFVGAIPFDSYDPRFRQGKIDPWPLVEEQDARNAAISKPYYTVRSGDIAFFALGQIVNRWCGDLRCYPGATFYSFHSNDKAFVNKVRNDWKGLSSTGLEQVILSDINHPDSIARQSLAMARYRCMFPDKAEVVAVKYLLAAYGSLPKGRPPGVFPTIFQQIQPIASAKLDKTCYELLLNKKKRATFRPEYKFTETDILDYLALRPSYNGKAIQYAKEAISRKDPLSSEFVKFLIRQRSFAL